VGIDKAVASNLDELVKLSVLLFPEDTYEDLLDVYREVLIKDNEDGYLYEKDSRFIGYMHLSVRSDYVNGTDTSPVAFVEAIYVLPEYRKHGIGREFIKFAEAYARERGITQLASDCFIDNTMSEQFHKSCGFEEKERVICFVKDVKEDCDYV
jgi:aminoglycoside 6'-N-acetyltransferase I